MIDILSSTAAAVDTFAELKTVLEGTGEDYGTITTVYLKGDITQAAQPVTVPLSKPVVVIDGTYNDYRCTYTTTADSYYNVITTANPGTEAIPMSITMQHMDITGKNFYGAMGSLDNANFINVIFTYKDINYAGAQANYHRYGTVHYIDSVMNISRDEVAECGRVILEGKVSITHTTAAYSAFWMYYDTGRQYVRITAGADVTIKSNYAPFYIKDGAEFIIEDGAKLVVDAPRGMSFIGNSYSRFEVGVGASFSCTQTVNAYPTINVAGTLEVKEHASVYLHKTTGAQPVIKAASSQITITSPDQFVIISSTGNTMTLTGTNQLYVKGDQINLWNSAGSSSDPGGFTDIPKYSWRKTPLADQTAPEVYIRGAAGPTAFTPDADGTNLTADELNGKPLTGLRLDQGYVFSLGKLPLVVAYITDDGWPVMGTTAANTAVQVRSDAFAVLTGAAADDGQFSIETETPIPLDTAVTVAVNRPYLLREYSGRTVPAGALTVDAAPAQILFDFKKKLSLDPYLIGREDDDMYLVIRDTRARSSAWKLSAVLEQALASYTDDGAVKCTLPGALVFVAADQSVRALGREALTVWEGQANDGDREKEWIVTWAREQGFLMTTGVNPFCAGDMYTADITWQLEAKSAADG